MEITALGIDVNSSTFYVFSQYVCRSLPSHRTRNVNQEVEERITSQTHS